VATRVRGRPATPKSCHERALGLLAVRPRSRRELERRLLAAGFERVEVDDVLARLQRVGLIDDRAFARQLADYQFGSRKAGARAVSAVLREKGVAPALVDEVLSEAPDDEEQRALALARSRATRMHGVDPAKAFDRLVGLLARRGYGHEVARWAARSALGLIDDG
jgi:regulatory protein